ncbi:MAG: hypothetical protein IT356_10190 [Gemmatimonadaceae bacterium]|nr:hypothetical protein [Gemmatimonadaceae bacterium]
MMRTALLLAFLAVAGCSGAKAPGPESAPAQPAAEAMPAPQQGAAEGAAPAPAPADTAPKRAAPPTGDERLRDSAFGPKFAVDSTGKVVPVKRP